MSLLSIYKLILKNYGVEFKEEEVIKFLLQTYSSLVEFFGIDEKIILDLEAFEKARKKGERQRAKHFKKYYCIKRDLTQQEVDNVKKYAFQKEFKQYEENFKSLLKFKTINKFFDHLANTNEVKSKLLVAYRKEKNKRDKTNIRLTRFSTALFLDFDHTIEIRKITKTNFYVIKIAKEKYDITHLTNFKTIKPVHRKRYDLDKSRKAFYVEQNELNKAVRTIVKDIVLKSAVKAKIPQREVFSQEDIIESIDNVSIRKRTFTDTDEKTIEAVKIFFGEVDITKFFDTDLVAKTFGFEGKYNSKSFHYTEETITQLLEDLKKRNSDLIKIKQ